MSEKPTYAELEKKNRELEIRLRMDRPDEPETHYRKILDCSPSVVYTKDLEGRYTSINKQFETLSGLKREDVIGKTDFELFPPQVAENSTKNDKQVIKTGAPKEVEEYGPVNGQIHAFISTKYPLTDNDGKIYGICGVSTDITDRKHTESQLAKVKSDLKDFFDLSPLIVCKVDLENGYFTEINSMATQILGYSIEELTSISIMEFIHPEDRQQTMDEIRQQIAGKRVERFANRYICKDGSQRWMSWYGTPADKVGEIIAIGLDITELKRIEDELRVSEQKFRSMAENVPGLVLKYKFNPDGSDELLYISKSVEDIFEVPQQDAFNNNKLLWDRIHEDDLEDYIKSIKTSAETLSLWEQEHRIQLPGDRVKWLYTRGVPLQQDDGSVIWDTIALDITAQKETEALLKENEQRYKSAQRMGNVGNWEYDLLTDTFWGSEQAKRIYGFDPQSMRFSADEVENCIPERGRVHQALVDLIENDKPYNLEFDIHPVSGPETRTIRSIAEIRRDETGAPLKVTGVIQDVTEQKNL